MIRHWWFRDRQRGAGVVGLLLVLVFLGVMAIVAITMLPGSDPPPVEDGPARTITTGTPSGAGSVIDAATVTSCRASAAAIETALATATAAQGTAPASLADLVRAGFLGEVPYLARYSFAVEAAPGGSTARVTVNGRPAAEGCAAPSGS